MTGQTGVMERVDPGEAPYEEAMRHMAGWTPAVRDAIALHLQKLP